MMTALAMAGVKIQQSTSNRSVEGGQWDTSTTAGGDKQQKRMADVEGSDEEGGKGEGNGDEGGGRATAMMTKKRVRAARVMVKREAVAEEIS